MSSMITKKDAEDFAQQMADLEKNKKDDRGPDDLERRIEDLMRIGLSHQNLNADLRKEISYLKDHLSFYKSQTDQLKKENQELRNKQQNFINEFRNKGDM
jgi:chromosome segregation ATPase